MHRSSDSARSLHTHIALVVILTLLLIVIGVIAAGVLTYQRSLSTLILSRQRQMASLAAVSVSQVMDREAGLLSVLANKPGFTLASHQTIVEALDGAGEVLEVFSAGVLVVEPGGDVLYSSSNDLDFLGKDFAGLEVFQSARQGSAPAYSDVMIDDRTGKGVVLVAVPLLTPQDSLMGALVGGIDLHNTSLSEPVRRLAVGFDGYAYLVDRNGLVISHPVAQEIGQDYGGRPFVKALIDRDAGESVWDSPVDGRYVGSSTLISSSGWAIVVEEPWSSIMAPIRSYGLMIGVLGFTALTITSIILWNGVQRVITPVKSLSKQTALLASGKAIEPIASSGIEEIDALERAFLNMAEQIDLYRSGLRKYVSSITQSQEEERRRISRELHDETVQNLLTIRRRLELCQATIEEPQLQAQLAQLVEIVETTLQGVRQISKDLRPLMLEDLGLVPALQVLVRSAHTGVMAIPQVKFEVSGEPYPMDPDQELALFRITQEALANVKKHAQATGVDVKLEFHPSEVCLEISDDGIGFEAPSSLAELTQMDSFGLMGIQERVWAAGGSLSIDSAPRKGTRLRVLLPVETAITPSITQIG